MNPTFTTHEREHRRKRAVAAVQEGQSPATVARVLGVDRGSVYRWLRLAREAGYVFPFLFDETQEVAMAYTAACTPDLFLFDADRALVYRGQLDDSRPSNGLPVTGADLRAAIDAVLSGGPVSKDQRASIGCGIKWRAGNEPAYA